MEARHMRGECSTQTKKMPRGAALEPLFPQLRARKNASPEAVAADQRARLHGAMVEAVARYGYTATTVQQLTSLAGVTKKTLYRHFACKQECFLSTYDRIVADGVVRISLAYRGESAGRMARVGSLDGGGREWERGLLRAFDAFVDELAKRPKPSRLALVDVLAAGPVALARIERGEALFERMIAQSFARAPDGVALSPLLVKGIVHGIWYVTRRRLLEGRPQAISGAGREMLDWMLTYRSAAASSLTADPAALRDATRGSGRGTPRLADADPRARMLRAAASVAATAGVKTLTSGQVIELAGVDRDAFSEHFESAEECFLASVELLSAQALGRSLRASEGAPDWPAAVCRSICRLLREVAEEPLFARVAFVEIFAAGPAGVMRRAALMHSFAEVLTRRAPRARRPSALVADAIVGAVWGVVHHHVVRGRARLLPALADHVVYLTLAPIVGAEPAVEAILVERAGGTIRKSA
jgi:AcrR family transcriptional regulator